MDSTPGLCILARYGSTNKQIFKWDGIKCDPDRVAEVKSIVRQRFNQLLEGNAVADPIKIFVKREAHKLKKLQTGAYRLISGVSLVDSLIDRILFGWILRRALDTVGTNPSMVGWSPVRGGWKYLKAYFAGKTLACLDKSAWDWTVQEWMIAAALDFIKQLAVNPPEWWIHMVELRFRLLFKDAVYQFSDGTQVKQPYWGIQKSGSLLTILLNTLWQYLLHVVARPEQPNIRMKIMGDDTVQEAPEDLEAYARDIAKLGACIKEVKTQNWIEFAGFAQFGMTCVPCYWRKHLFNLKYAERPMETLQSYQVLYSHDDIMSRYLERELLAYGAECVLPRSWCRSVMDRSERI